MLVLQFGRGRKSHGTSSRIRNESTRHGRRQGEQAGRRHSRRGPTSSFHFFVFCGCTSFCEIKTTKHTQAPYQTGSLSAPSDDWPSCFRPRLRPRFNPTWPIVCPSGFPRGSLERSLFTPLGKRFVSSDSKLTETGPETGVRDPDILESAPRASLVFFESDFA